MSAVVQWVIRCFLPHPSPLRGLDITLEEVHAGQQSASPSADDCPICLSPLVGQLATTQCGHRFHASCLEHHLRVGNRCARCPICRGSLRAPSAVTARASSGRPIDVVNRVPRAGDRCHLDRDYRFLSLGSFGQRPGTMFLLTSNDDKRTPAEAVMWTLAASAPVTVHLNFRSEGHVADTGAAGWLQEGGWERSALRSTVSTGFPSWLYWGPVYSKAFPAGRVQLRGSNCELGTYFVFLELHEQHPND
mmetsp:Transcript_76448/g.224319  ORF Transcript_76448/g.224319 Transcript_76448/m.224319 type:complete len:248 (-) Transcript_76448:130-873(-)